MSKILSSDGKMSRSGRMLKLFSFDGKMNRSKRNWAAMLEKLSSQEGEIVPKSPTKMINGLVERKISDENRQNLDVVFSTSSSSVVAVCVEKNSEHIVKWTLDNIVLEGDKLTLIHVMRPIVAIPTPMGNYMPIEQVCSDVADAYKRKVASQTLKSLKHLQQMCNSKKMLAEIIVLEDQNIPKAILTYISNSRISKLVMGCSSHLLRRKLQGHDMPASIVMKAPKFCYVYVISKGKLASVHPSNPSAKYSSNRNSECNLLPRGQRILEPSETNGNQSFENNRRSLKGAVALKPDIEIKLGRLDIKFQHPRETYRGATTLQEAIDAEYKAEVLNGPLIEKLLKLKETNDAFRSADERCKGYSIKQIELATNFFSESHKIGEGGYGPVYKGSLDNTTVAIKVLQRETAQGRDEFQREIEVLSRIHHPNMVLLLGTCPERGCLVYEYMANGSLEDHLFDKGTRASLPWFVRFRIASEIASALHFLHTTKPEPIVHRDLKPANILLDSNFVSKIGDVGLAKLIPSTASYSVTEYRNTLLAGTFCYMDPEYLRTGTFRPKSDLYALGIILLQLLTAKHPMALTEKVETAIEEGSFNHILDKTAGGWPLDETIEFAKLALKCTELRRRDRPDLETIVLPELERFRHLADAHAEHCTSWLLKLSNSSGGFTLVQNCS